MSQNLKALRSSIQSDNCIQNIYQFYLNVQQEGGKVKRVECYFSRATRELGGDDIKLLPHSIISCFVL